MSTSTVHYRGQGRASKVACGRLSALHETQNPHHVSCRNCIRVLITLGWGDLRDKLKKPRPVHPLFPVGSRVVLIESGAAGSVVAHVRASLDDRPATKAHRVRWDSHGTTSYVRPGRLRLETA